MHGRRSGCLAVGFPRASLAQKAYSYPSSGWRIAWLSGCATRAANTGRLQWDPPPMLTDVELILQANLGKAIKDLGDLDV